MFLYNVSNSQHWQTDLDTSVVALVVWFFCYWAGELCSQGHSDTSVARTINDGSLDLEQVYWGPLFCHSCFTGTSECFNLNSMYAIMCIRLIEVADGKQINNNPQTCSIRCQMEKCFIGVPISVQVS